MVITACTTDNTESVKMSVPDVLEVTLDEGSRVQLDESVQTVWTKGDKVSVFYRSDANGCWAFAGETGEVSGSLNRESEGTPSMTTEEIVAVYPYSAAHTLYPNSKSVGVEIPETQTYLANSYGLGSNLMVYSGTSNTLSMKSALGWLKLQITGSRTVKKIVLKGNNNEPLSGKTLVNYGGELPVISFEDGASADSGGTPASDNSLTLDCGAGVVLKSGTPTSFFFSVVPQNFANGITAVVHCTDGTCMTKTTSNSINIKRNTILPLGDFAYIADASAAARPVADLLDVVFNADGSAKDISPMKNPVVYMPGQAASYYYNATYDRMVANFNHEAGSSSHTSGYYRIDNDNMWDKLADGHSMEALVRVDITNGKEMKPFSGHQSGGTGLMISKAEADGYTASLTFLPNVTKTEGGSSNWIW